MNDYDKMRACDNFDDDALNDDELEQVLTEKEKYLDFYDDIKTSIKDDW